MTNKEAKKAEKELNALLNMCNPSPLTKELEDALKMAIKALEQQPQTIVMTKEEFERYLANEDLVVVKRKFLNEALEAQPCIEDYPTCTECEHYDSEKHYCPRFCQVIKDTLAEVQPCEDSIRELIREFDNKHPALFADYMREFNSHPIAEIIEYMWDMHDLIEDIKYRLPNEDGAEMSGGGEDEVSD